MKVERVTMRIDRGSSGAPDRRCGQEVERGMVFYKDYRPEARPRIEHTFHDLEGGKLRAVSVLPRDLRSDHGAAYLRLLAQLASFGIDAAGPPLLAGECRRS